METPEPSHVVHPLKTWPEFFQHILAGTKTFELRKNDRGFMPGDTLLLKEWDPLLEAYTGREVEAFVTYMVGGGQLGLPPHLCVMAIRTGATQKLVEENERLRLLRDNIQSQLIDPCVRDLQQTVERLEADNKRLRGDPLFLFGIKVFKNPIVPPGEIWMASEHSIVKRMPDGSMEILTKSEEAADVRPHDPR